MYKSPLKWVGSKAKSVKYIVPLLTQGHMLYEPFAGTGVISLNAPGFNHYYLSDTNQDLIGFHRHVSQYVPDWEENFIDTCEKLFTPRLNTQAAYDALRIVFNLTGHNNKIRYALFAYFNRHSYNGLVRYNASGEFNAPFGRYKNPYFPRQEMVMFRDRMAQRAFWGDHNWEVSFELAHPGDVIYCDPPYLTDKGFTSYGAAKFTTADHMLLAQAARDTSARGVRVLISNHDTPETRLLYTDAEIYAWDVRHSVSCKADGRTMNKELLVVYKARSPRGE